MSVNGHMTYRCVFFNVFYYLLFSDVNLIYYIFYSVLF